MRRVLVTRPECVAVLDPIDSVLIEGRDSRDEGALLGAYQELAREDEEVPLELRLANSCDWSPSLLKELGEKRVRVLES